MKNILAKTALFTGLLTMPLTANIDAKNISNRIEPSPQFPTEEVKKTTRDNVLFTIDDWPSIYMLEIAKTLDSLDYQWIFFVVTRGVEKKRQELIEVLKMWHHVGNHSYDHANFQTLSIDQAKQQILVWDSLIASVYEEAGIPREKKYMRYPFGDEISSQYKEEFTIFLDSLWYEKPMKRHMDVDLHDYLQLPADEKIVRTKEWDTILIHERSWTVNTLNKIVDHLDISSEY